MKIEIAKDGTDRYIVMVNDVIVLDPISSAELKDITISELAEYYEAMEE